jgi:hypothetical protein
MTDCHDCRLLKGMHSRDVRAVTAGRSEAFLALRDELCAAPGARSRRQGQDLRGGDGELPAAASACWAFAALAARRRLIHIQISIVATFR